MYEQHWRYMRRIIELGDGPNVYARYNTNLSRVNYRGIDLYSDILDHLRDWQVCASLDGTAAVGEYIRTGLDYSSWLLNFEQGVKIQKNRRQMRIDFTLTLPGMFEIINIERLASDLGVDILSKVIFSFSPDIVMSPLALPRDLLDRWIDQLMPQCNTQVMRDMLLQLKQRPTFAEQWPDSWQQGLSYGKRRMLRLEKLRNTVYGLDDILKQDNKVYEWWKNITTD
jgi:hypothetical protein